MNLTSPVSTTGKWMSTAREQVVTGDHLDASVSTVDLTSPVSTTGRRISTTREQVVTGGRLDESVSTTKDLTSSVSSTVPVFEIPPTQLDCPPINDTRALVNSTAVVEGTVVHVSCRSPSKLLVPRNNIDVFSCIGGHWRPLTPTCSTVGSDNSAPVGVIVGCTVGGFVCLVLVVIALYMLHKSLKETREQRDRNKEFNDKMDQIGSYVNSTFQDSVGMPVLTMDTRDPELRGRVTQTTLSPSVPPEQTDPPDAVKLGAALF